MYNDATVVIGDRYVIDGDCVIVGDDCDLIDRSMTSEDYRRKLSGWLNFS
jgi:hypothetical protein